ncbi:MAG TPA: FG-GAP-like repeat-containing protein [Candidatus Saccharimonadales bacterium]|nr:FG-GAP-like repeat-containing protein [Candidatus Saccharimonadales bacterium]
MPMLAILAMLFGLSALSLSNASPAKADDTSTINGAINWAEGKMGSTSYDGLCLSFVHDAYSAAGLNIGTGYSNAIGYWNQHTQSKHVDADAPAGALVFWGANPYTSDGHVALSLGGGTVISSEERGIAGVHEFTIANRNNAASYYASSYLGWMMPPGISDPTNTAGNGVSGDRNHDGYSDPYIVASTGTGSGKVEAHVLNGTNFNSWLSQIATSASPASTANVKYLLGDYNGDHNQDLYIIAHDGTSSGKVEVHILEGPNFQVSLGDWVTPWGSIADDRADFALGGRNSDGYPDLYVAVLNGTGSGKVEVHVLGGTNFQSSLGDWATVSGTVAAGKGQIVLGDFNKDGYPDLYEVFLNGTGSGTEEVHILNGTNFQSWLGHWATPAGIASTTQERVLIGDFNHDGWPDLYNMYYSGGSGKVEVHILDGTNFASFLGHWATVAAGTSSSLVEFANG